MNIELNKIKSLTCIECNKLYFEYCEVLCHENICVPCFADEIYLAGSFVDVLLVDSFVETRVVLRETAQMLLFFLVRPEINAVSKPNS